MATPSASGAYDNDNSGGSTPQARHALPARPPPPANPTPAVPVTYGGAAYGHRGSGYGNGYGNTTWSRQNDYNGNPPSGVKFQRALAKLRAVASAYQSYPQATTYPSMTDFSATVGPPAYYSTANYQQQYYPTTTPSYSATPTQATNPYSAPTVNNDLDAEQYAQWQSGFGGKDDAKKTTSSAYATPNAAAAAATVADGKKRTVVRNAGGKIWQDDSLLEWPVGHQRIFVGNLSGEVTDDTLQKAFKEYPSLSKWKVIREKNTNKSKGFGFVSFGNADDYFKAYKEKQGKYIGAHPVQLQPAKPIQAASIAQNNHGKKNWHGKNRSGANQYNAGNSANSDANSNKKDAKDKTQGGQSGPGSYGGVTKHKKKEKGGLKILG